MDNYINLYECLNMPLSKIYSQDMLDKLKAFEVTKYRLVSYKKVKAMIHDSISEYYYNTEINIISNQLITSCDCLKKNCIHSAKLFSYMLNDEEGFLKLSYPKHSIISKDIVQYAYDFELSSINFPQFKRNYESYLAILNYYVSHNEFVTGTDFFLELVEGIKDVKGYRLDNPLFFKIMKDLVSYYTSIMISNRDFFTKNSVSIFGVAGNFSLFTLSNILPKLFSFSEIKKQSEDFLWLSNYLEENTKLYLKRSFAYAYHPIIEYSNFYMYYNIVIGNQKMVDYLLKLFINNKIDDNQCSFLFEYYIENKNYNDLASILRNTIRHALDVKLLKKFVILATEQNKLESSMDIISSSIGSKYIEIDIINELVDLFSNCTITLQNQLASIIYYRHAEFLPKLANKGKIYELLDFASRDFRSFCKNIKEYLPEYEDTVEAIIYTTLLLFIQDRSIENTFTIRELFSYIDILYSLPNGNLYLFDLIYNYPVYMFNQTRDRINDYIHAKLKGGKK